MIGQVNRALSALLTPLLPAGYAVHFGPPGTERGLCLLLAGVREDEAGSGTDWTDLRDADGRVTARRPPIRRFDLRYLVTAVAADTDAEATLFDAVLAAVDPKQRLDRALLGEDLAGQPVTLRLDPTPAGHPDRTVLGIVANAPLVLAPVTDLERGAEQISLGVTPPGRPIRPPAAVPPSRRWGAARITED